MNKKHKKELKRKLKRKQLKKRELSNQTDNNPQISMDSDLATSLENNNETKIINY
jgi:hypothetical protein